MTGTNEADQRPSEEDDEALAMRAKRRKASHDYRASVFNVICGYGDDKSLSGAELFDSSWSDSDSFSEGRELDEASTRKASKLEEDNAEGSGGRNSVKEPSNGASVKARKIADELLKTEHAYVDRLHLLHQVFYVRLDHENRQQPMFPQEVLNQMFLNIRSIFLFHHDFLLPQLEDRIKNWNSDSRIGDLMKQNAPFLKMYSEYIRNFDQAMKLINHWTEKSSRFLNIIKEIQRLPECGNLSLQHHMLGPIQRVPRYELLLKDYIKELPATSPDIGDANDALELVARASSHSNEALKKTEKFCQLLDIYQSLRGVAADFISPSRELKESGPVIKISARTGERQQRHIFLFSDLMFICTPYMRVSYNVRCQMDVEDIEIKPSEGGIQNNSFTVQCKQKVVELLDENQTGEPFGWEEKIKTVIHAQRERKKTIKLELSEENSPEQQNIEGENLGKTAPVWMEDNAVSMCMTCEAHFSVFRRRHHCRACGKLVCKSCCKKAPLDYKQGKIERVCCKCHHILIHKKPLSRQKSSCDYCKKEGFI